MALLVSSTMAWADTWDGTTTTKPDRWGGTSGSTENDYIFIESAAQLAYIRDHWNEVSDITIYAVNKQYCKWNYKLYADIDMGNWSWTPLGSDAYQGTFDGQGHTIRFNISGATNNYQGLFASIAESGRVKNLHVSGNIHCSTSRLVGAIAGENNGTISNCWVSTNVRSDWHESWSSYTAKVGGIAGENNGTVEYCCMAGNVTNNDADVGGLVGDNNDGTVRHCTFYGSVSTTHSQDNKYAGDSGTENSCYDSFNQSEYDAASGYDTYRNAIQRPYAINISTVGNGTYAAKVGEATVTGAYPGQTVTLTKTSGLNVYGVTIKDADGNNVAYSGADVNQPITITMPRNDVNVTAVFYTTDWDSNDLGTEQNPYIINKELEWNAFAEKVNAGKDFSGKYVKLTANITVEKMVGIKDDATLRPFSGHFDGGGNTINCQISANEHFVAPFRYTDGATFKDLTLTGSVTITGNEHSDLGGIVAYAKGTLTFTNCKVSTTLTASANVTAGGFVGDAENASFEKCTFDGKLLGNAYYCGGFVGFIAGYSNVLNNCLFKPSELTITANNRSTFVCQQDDNATFSNCYYMQALGTAQGGKVYATEPTHGFYAAVTAADSHTYYWVIGTEGESGGAKTYQISDDIDVASRIITKGTVVLTLDEGKTLHAGKGIELSADNQANLTINGPGALTIDGCNEKKSGIGAVNVGTLTINGGTLNVYGGNYAAGIGGDSNNTSGGSITINGGVVNARAYHASAGIGGGRSDYGSPCGDIVINGGQVTARGNWVYGIGPGFMTSGGEYHSGTLTLNLTNPDDFVNISSSNSAFSNMSLSSITIAEGKTLCDENGVTYSSGNVDNIYGKPLRLLTAADLPTDNEGSYLISNRKEWNTFCANVNAGKSYSDETVKLTTDISGVTMTAGTEEHPFKGTFDGDNHTLTVNIISSGTAALFGRVADATIRELHVAGSVQSTMTNGADHTAGLVCKTAGTVKIVNVRVSATVTGYTYYGGFIGHGGISGITMTGCVFDGTLKENSAGSTQHAGGFIGWGGNMGIKMTDCLFAGTYTIGTGGSGKKNFHPVGYYSSFDDVNNGGTFTLTPQLSNVYYTVAPSAQTLENYGQALSNGEKQAYTISTSDANVTALAISGDAAVHYAVSGLKCYAAGIEYGFQYGSTFYAGSGDTISLSLAHTAAEVAQHFTGYQTTSGEFTEQTETSAKLCMGDTNAEISALYADNTRHDMSFVDATATTSGWSTTPVGMAREDETVTISYQGEHKVKRVTVKPYTKAAEATAADVGKLICADGHIHDYVTGVACKADRVAKIIYVGSETGDDTYNHGLALAMWDVSNTSYSQGASWADQYVRCLKFYSDETAAKGDMAGLANTNTLLEHVSLEYHKHEAATLARNHTGGTHPTGTSEWFLPSVGQWEKMFAAAGGFAALRNGFESVGGQNMNIDLYWSSTAIDSSHAWTYGLEDGKLYQQQKAWPHSVRPVIAF